MIWDISAVSGTVSTAVAFITALLAIVVAARDHRSFPNRCFIAGLTAVASAELFRGLALRAEGISDPASWLTFSTAVSALGPATFLLFSLSFARLEYRKYIARWKYVIGALFGIPILALIVAPRVFSPLPSDDPLALRIIPLTISGKIVHLATLMSAVFILANLERTLRASTGRIRWQIKFIVLGTGAICAVWIYTSSQALIYSALDTSFSILHPAALLAADVLFAWGLLRSKFLNVDVYLSRATIQYSLTALLAGIYLVSVGFLAYMVRFFGRQRPLPLDALLVLAALAGLAMLLLSDRLQERLRRLVTRHFRRPMYDYRKAWMDLTERTNSLLGPRELCAAVARIISQTFGILSVNIWLSDEAGKHLSLAGSTVFTPVQAHELDRSGDAVSDILRAVENRNAPIDLDEKSYEWAEDIMRSRPEYFQEFRMRYIVPLQTGGRLVGIITLNGDRVGKSPLSLEDQDLLNAYAAQLAARVLQLRLSENLRQAQEIEAFQNVSAFFVHDLKNLASRLSLTMQNLPAYFDNPEFRGDALKLIGESVARIDTTCGRLSSLKQKIELRLADADLNELVEKTLDEFRHCARLPLEKDLKPVPAIPLDAEQLQKVLMNLLLNAQEAANGKGAIRITTATVDHQVMLSVTDCGCGMSREFIEGSLFRPFKSTKKRGMGIGLFHCKMIVEAHHGRIEVESREGEGTTFRIVLPMTRPQGAS